MQKLSQNDFLQKDTLTVYLKNLDFKGNILGLLQPEIEENYNIEVGYCVVLRGIGYWDDFAECIEILIYALEYSKN